MNGVLLFDKQKGKTSSQTILELKKVLNLKKVGHAGTLDKNATGLLVVCTGQSTRLTHYFLENDKRYLAFIKLGITTDSYDSEGIVTELKEYVDFDKKKIATIKEKFTGELLQMPPLYSALKVGGKRASDRTRSGQAVYLKPRKIEIKKIDIIETDEVNGTVAIDVLCSKGTYIRSLARDIGEYLGTGAIVQDLRRTESGIFSVGNALSNDELQAVIDGISPGKKYFYKPLEAVPQFSCITVNERAVKKIQNGSAFDPNDIISIEKRTGKLYSITDKGKNLIAIADIDTDNWSIKYKNVFEK